MKHRDQGAVSRSPQPPASPSGRAGLLGLRRWRVPIALAVMCIVTQGLLTPWMGLYDDWGLMFIGQVSGSSGIHETFAIDRPLTAWTYSALTWVFGANLLAWHLWAVVCRWALGVTAWVIVRRVWPEREFEAFAVAILFVFSPGFSGWPMPVIFSLGLTSFLLFMGSLVFSLRAVTERGTARFARHGAAVLLLAASIPPEVLVPLEVIRPALFVVLLGRLGFAGRRRVTAALRHWLPYIPVIAAFVFWRSFIFEPARANFEATALANLVRNPLDEVSTLLGLVRHDLWLGIVRVWARPFSGADQGPALTHFSGVTWTLGVLLVMGVAACAVWWGFGSRGSIVRHARSREDDRMRRRWGAQAMGVGLLAALLAGTPWWVSHRSGFLNSLQDPIYLYVSLGAGMLLVGALTWLSHRRVVVVAVVLALTLPAVGFHHDVARQEVDDWERQRELATQLGILAPDLADNTALVLDGDVFLVQRGYTIGAMVALMYGGSAWDGADIHPRVWAFDADWNARRGIEERERRVVWDFRAISFIAGFDDVVVLRYRPPGCLRLFGRHWREIPDLTDPELTVASESEPGQIVGGAEPREPPGFVGSGPVGEWCDAFVRAQWLAENERWGVVANLGSTVLERDLQPGEPSEWLVYVEALLRAERPTEAADALGAAASTERRALCAFVRRISNEREISDGLAIRVVEEAGVDECVPSSDAVSQRTAE